MTAPSPGRLAYEADVSRRPTYRIEGPALVSFSGGRTSAYMLRQILDAHGGTLPADVHAVFANTGKERPETLDFVQECATRWDVPVTWVEYREGKPGFKVVSHNSASRAGEPFAALIGKRNFLPNPVTRFCTQELKIRVMKGFMLAQGYEHWANVVGLRADEPHRTAKGRAGNAAGKERWQTAWPLADAGIVERAVLAFWRAQPFNLGLRSHEGNCDLCFLKAGRIVQEIMAAKPELADWWIEQESQFALTQRANDTCYFRKDRPSYAELLDATRRQHVMDLGDADLLSSYMCGVG